MTTVEKINSLRELPGIVTVESPELRILRRIEKQNEEIINLLRSGSTPQEKPAKPEKVRVKNKHGEVAAAIVEALKSGPMHIFELNKAINLPGILTFPVAETATNASCQNLLDNNKVIRVRKGVHGLPEVAANEQPAD